MQTSGHGRYLVAGALEVKINHHSVVLCNLALQRLAHHLCSNTPLVLFDFVFIHYNVDSLGCTPFNAKFGGYQV